MKTSREVVCVLVLCHGDRLEYLKKTLDAVDRNEPGRIILIANAVSQRVWQEIEPRAVEQSTKYSIVSSEVNLGSAGGYALGIETALSLPEFEFLWLLDDDNCPTDRALDSLLKCWEEASEDTVHAVFAHRKTEKKNSYTDQWIAKTPREGSCVGFHILDLLPALTGQTSPSSKTDISLWTTYSGLLIPTDLVHQIGLPKKEFFIDGDDMEWTLRITRNGGRIIPCPSAEVIDLCPSWLTNAGRKSRLSHRICDLESFRVYYEIRNRTWIVRQYFSGHYIVYYINRALFMFFAGLLAILYRRPGRFKLIRRALHDGESGQLGPVPQEIYD